MGADILEEVDEGHQYSAHLGLHGSQPGSALCRHHRGEQQHSDMEADILEEVNESDHAEAPGQALICCMTAFGSSDCSAVARGQENH